MPRKKILPTAPMGRTKKEIDWDLVDLMLKANCHGTECAARFNVCPDTFYDRVKAEHGVSFTEYSAERKAEGDSYIKVVQYEKALEKDNTMLIWLGKIRLEQKEAIDLKTVYPNDEKLAHEANETKLKYELLLKAEENKKLKEELDGLKRQANPIDQ